MRVHLALLRRRLAGLPVTSCPFPPVKLGSGAPDTDEDDLVGSQHAQAVGEPPLLGEHVVDHEVVASLSHASHPAAGSLTSSGPGACRQS